MLWDLFALGDKRLSAKTLAGSFDGSKDCPNVGSSPEMLPEMLLFVGAGLLGCFQVFVASADVPQERHHHVDKRVVISIHKQVCFVIQSSVQ
jgi:hypothetical protein